MINKSHSESSMCSSLDYVPTDWFLKRRKLRLRRWERNGGLERWRKSNGVQTLHSKCVTDTSLAKELGVEVGLALL